ncbi:MAG: NAD-dependent epimerase/dehydratase family protein, partial [Bacteroidia bacterium]|nr:NAD-dependent epimerase/dehydratase family protein [Bacteroidia bacterium]
MRILITGGTGLVGKHLTHAFIERGDEVVVLTRKPSHSSKSVDYVHWNGKIIPEAVGNIDVVINLAGASIIDHPWTNAYKKIILESRLHATQACSHFINTSEYKPQLFISASAVGYYGTQNPQVVDESAPPGKDFLAQTCVKWEEAAKNASIRTVITRIGIVMDKTEGAFPRLLAPFKF